MTTGTFTSTWYHDQAMTTADAAKHVADEPGLSAFLFETAARFEELAIRELTETHPERTRTLRILGESRDALRAEAAAADPTRAREPDDDDLTEPPSPEIWSEERLARSSRAAAVRAATPAPEGGE